MTRCPSSEQLQQLLADQLSGPEVEAVESHVQACADCQQALELRNQGHDGVFIAEQLGDNPVALRKQLARALDRVSRQLGLEDDHD